jgi:plastocyanin
VSLLRTTTCAVAALAALAGCGGGGGPDAGAAGGRAAVEISTFQFQPDPITVEAGTTILFTNHDKIDHTVTAGTREAPTPDVFDGQLPEQGATFELVLDEPGTYDYFCEIHQGPGMTGSIVVE